VMYQGCNRGLAEIANPSSLKIVADKWHGPQNSIARRLSGQRPSEKYVLNRSWASNGIFVSDCPPFAICMMERAVTQHAVHQVYVQGLVKVRAENSSFSMKSYASSSATLR